MFCPMCGASDLMRADIGGGETHIVVTRLSETSALTPDNEKAK